jgi:general secretion pathway protein K
VSAEPSRERGIALLIVLLAITLLTIVVIEFTDYTQVETHLALSARNALQATYLARSGVNIAELVLIADSTYDTARSRTIDTLDDVWAGPHPPWPIGDGTVAFQVQDEARFLNLNDMFSKDGVLRPERYQVFQRLFATLAVNERILAAIVDWVDADHNPYLTPLGAESTFYLAQTPPILIRDAPFLTLRELLLVREVTPTIFDRLVKYVTVLPPMDALKVNINTADPPVLAALSEGMRANPGVVKRLDEIRRTEPFVNATAELKGVPGLAEALENSGASLVTNSTYFRIEAIAQMNDVHRGVVEVVKREGSKITRVTWTPSSATLALTSLPPSDFLATLPPLGGS